MEPPKQIIIGAWAFLIALVVISLLAELLFSILPRGPHVKDYTGPIGIVIFLTVWWSSYAAIIRYRNGRKNKEGNL